MMNKQFTFDENLVSDLHKQAYGHRPSGSFWMAWGEASDQRRQEIWDDLLVDMERTFLAEKQAEMNACVDLEQRILAFLGANEGSTRLDAIHYLLEEYDCSGDVVYLEWSLNVPYGYLTKEFGLYMEVA